MAGLRGNILITGGAGFLGRGIMRAAKRDGWDAHFTVFSRDEQKQAYCRTLYPDAHYVLGDITDTERLWLAMLGHDYVIHAAALKYIPEGEFNADECVRVNIDGARSVITAARSAKVQRVVGISTDKAAQPVNIYGMTKAVMERLFAEASDVFGPVFTTCRYGNVIGSTGSVVPVMREQYRTFKMVQITDTYMTRFWMPIDAAVNTILRAFEAPAGSVTIPTPRAASMRALALAVLGSLDLTMYPDPEVADPRIKIVGPRPGEKQHEDLVSHYELYRTTVDGEWYTLMPPGNENYSVETATVSSDRSRGVDREVLAEWIKDAVTV